jgi:hypothetical protein
VRQELVHRARAAKRTTRLLDSLAHRPHTCRFLPRARHLALIEGSVRPRKYVNQHGVGASVSLEETSNRPPLRAPEDLSALCPHLNTYHQGTSSAIVPEPQLWTRTAAIDTAREGARTAAGSTWKSWSPCTVRSHIHPSCAAGAEPPTTAATWPSGVSRWVLIFDSLFTTNHLSRLKFLRHQVVGIES